MARSKALLLCLLVASAGRSSGAGGPLYWDGTPATSRELTAEQADLRQPAAAPVALDPFCDKYRLFDAKKTRANCDTMITGFLTYATTLLAGFGGSGGSTTVVNIINTVVIEQIQNTVVSTISTIADTLTQSIGGNIPAAPAGAGSRLGAGSVLPAVAPLELNETALDAVIFRVGLLLRDGLISVLAAEAGLDPGYDVWNEEPMSEVINVRVFNDLTFDNNTDSPLRAVILAAALGTDLNGTDRLAVSVQESLGEAAGGQCDAVIAAALEAAGAITGAILNATDGAGGAVAGVALSEARAALSEASAAPNSTIVAALADAASALSAAVLTRTLEELRTTGSDVASAARAIADSIVLSTISKGNGPAPQGQVLQALSNGTSALSAALAKLVAAEVSGAASALRATLSSLADSRVEAAISGDGGVIVGRLKNESSLASQAVMARLLAAAGGILTPADFAKSLAAAISNASGVVPTELARANSPIRSAAVAPAAPEAAAAVAGALLAGGAVTGALGDTTSGAGKALAGAVATKLGDPAATVTQAADAAITADVLAALQNNVSGIAGPVITAATNMAKGGVGVEFTSAVQLAVQSGLTAVRQQTGLCGKLGAPFEITGTGSLTMQPASLALPVQGTASCSAGTQYLVHGACSLNMQGSPYTYSLNGEDLDYTTNSVTCKAGPIKVFAGVNPPEGTITVTAVALCCPINQQG